ncbi:MAG TPA: glycosyltransferase family 2 protein [Beijerinckiaceae bacterium]|jgi:glycosyltransferase involved in cell wall biosynthesis
MASPIGSATADFDRSDGAPHSAPSVAGERDDSAVAAAPPRAPARVTCTIIARNEADRIGRAIVSVRDLVDEVLVVDSGSTDRTREVAAALGARVVENPWTGYGPQKRFAEDMARNDWILNLDADEWLSDELREELRALFAAERRASTYRMRVTLVYPHRDGPAPFANSTVCLRLYDRRVARFSESPAFDSVPPRPDTVMLRGRIWHKSFRGLADVVRKELAYFELQSREKRRSPAHVALRLPLELPWQFFRYYILDRHVFGGAYGFAAALTIAFLRFMRLVIQRGW